MANIAELLEQLNTEEAAILTGDLAGKIRATKEGTLKQLNREKDKGHVEGNSQEGWLITEAGREALEKGEIHPSMLDEGVTPRQQFEAIGKRIGIKEDRIVLATDIVWSGDLSDVKWVWEALGQANIANDLRSVWVNAWRAKLQKSIPPELETELTGVSKTGVGVGGGAAPSKPGGREFIIVEDEPVRVGENLGDYSLQDAKDILNIRALRSRFSGAGQSGGTSPPGAAEKVSDVLTALSPYLNKDSDQGVLRELITSQMELQKRDILGSIPQQGQTAQPKSFIEQMTEVIAAFGSLRELGPILRSVLGVPESSGNPGSTAFPVTLKGANGEPIVMDLSKYIDLERFRGEERRADVRQEEITKTLQTARENIPDGIQAILKTVAEAKGSAGAKTSAQQEQPVVFECEDCHAQFSPPAGWKGEPIKCPGCSREYSKEELQR